ILRAVVRALAIHLRGIVHLPKRIEQPLVANRCGIKGDLYDLRMTGLVRANVLVRRVNNVPAAVSRLRFDHPRYLAEVCFNSPEASGSERSNLCHFAPLFTLLRLSAD